MKTARERIADFFRLNGIEEHGFIISILAIILFVIFQPSIPGLLVLPFILYPPVFVSCWFWGIFARAANKAKDSYKSDKIFLFLYAFSSLGMVLLTSFYFLEGIAPYGTFGMEYLHIETYDWFFFGIFLSFLVLHSFLRQHILK